MLERCIVIFFMLLFTLPIFQSAFNAIHHQQLVNDAQEETRTATAVNQSHLRCLATGIYYEAASETLIGQAAVARVIMNRVLHGFASNPCKVVYQTSNKNGNKSCQFSWVCEGKTTPNEDNPRYQNAMLIAKQVLVEDKWSDIIPNNTLFFHNKKISPGWVYKRVTTIGNHVFYAKGHEKKTNTYRRTDK